MYGDILSHVRPVFYGYDLFVYGSLFFTAAVNIVSPQSSQFKIKLCISSITIKQYSDSHLYYLLISSLLVVICNDLNFA